MTLQDDRVTWELLLSIAAAAYDLTLVDSEYSQRVNERCRNPLVGDLVIEITRATIAKDIDGIGWLRKHNADEGLAIVERDGKMTTWENAKIVAVPTAAMTRRARIACDEKSCSE